MNSRTPIPCPSGEIFTHEQSGLCFPSTVVAFERNSIHRYDEYGLNISVGYHILRGGPRMQELQATAYVYPRPHPQADPLKDLDAHWPELLANVSKIHPDPQPIRGAQFPVAGWLAQHQGRGMVLGYQDVWSPRGPLATLSHLYLFARDRWYLKYRVSYPEDDWPYVDHHILALMGEVGMPGGT